MALFCPPTGSPLYHYTTGTALIEIVRSHELWATQLACLNDASEFAYPIDLLLKKVLAHASVTSSDDEKFLFERMASGLAATRIATEGRFVACFSEDGDELSQWRAYGGGENGYSLKFDYLRLRTIPDNTMILGRVLYDEAAQERFIEDVMTHTIFFFQKGLNNHGAPNREAWCIEFLECWAQQVAAFAPFIKHPKFHAEREWRLVYHLQDEAIPRMRYQQRDSMLTKHVPLRLTYENNRLKLPLTGVTVGPSRHKAISRISVGDLLRSQGYSGVPVIETEVPYRTV